MIGFDVLIHHQFVAGVGMTTYSLGSLRRALRDLSVVHGSDQDGNSSSGG